MIKGYEIKKGELNVNNRLFTISPKTRSTQVRRIKSNTRQKTYRISCPKL